MSARHGGPAIPTEGRREALAARRRAQLPEIAAHAFTRAGRQFDEYSATVFRVGAAQEQAGVGHRLDSAQRGGRGNRGGDAQRTDRNAVLRKLGLEQVEQHVPRRIGEQFLREEARPKPPRADHRADHVDA